MNIFRVGRGDFLGTFIPGAFLLAHIILTLTSSTAAVTTSTSTLFGLPHDSVALLPLLFVAAYILGFFLRLIPPTFTEYLGLPFRLILDVPMALHWCHKRKKAGHPHKFKQLYRVRVRRSLEPFPYIDWFFKQYLRTSPASYANFYRQLLNREFGSKRERLKGLLFFNQCKVFIFHVTPSLREEVIQSEGLVRFVSGMSLALIPGTGGIWYASYSASQIPTMLVFAHLFVLVGFLVRLRHVRVREMTTLCDSYAFALRGKPPTS